MIVKVFRHFVPASVLLLAAFEMGLIFSIGYFYFAEKPILTTTLNDLVRSPALFMVLAAGCVMAMTGLYHNKAFSNPRVMAMQIAIAFVALCIFGLFVNVFFNASIGLPASPWIFDEKAALTWLICILLTRTAYARVTALRLFKKRVLVLGSGHKASRIAKLATARTNRHFVPVSYLRYGNDSPVVNAVEIITSENPDVLVERARQFGANEIVVATDDRRGLPINELLRCRAAGIPVVDYLDFIERQTKTVDLDALQPSWLVFSHGFRGSRFAEGCKRCLDVVTSLALLVFTLPLLLLVSLLITLDSRGPVLYRQERVGLNGRVFVLLKFRSMGVDAEKDGTPRWASARDPRVTRVGALIRKLRIDELPQLLNVLKGDMSLVGPRPERPAFVNQFTSCIRFYAERHYVKPGITGWAQVSFPYGASLDDAKDKLSYDLYYVKNHSLFLDIVILFRTVRVVFWGDGAR